MIGRENASERGDGCRSTRRDFNVKLAVLLLSACAPLSLGPGSSSDHGRWILNERDH